MELALQVVFFILLEKHFTDEGIGGRRIGLNWGNNDKFFIIFINKIIAWKRKNNKEYFSRSNLSGWVRDGEIFRKI
jgi:hypothetical protein